MLYHSTVLSKCIETVIQPKIKVPTAKITNPARVLTSHEHLHAFSYRKRREKKAGSKNEGKASN